VVAKRLELARELVLPGANIGLLVNPYNPPRAFPVGIESEGFPTAVA